MIDPQKIWYILSSDKRSFIVAELLEDIWLTSGELFSKFEDQYPYLTGKGFIEKPKALRTVLCKSLTTGGVLERDEETRSYPCNATRDVYIWKLSGSGNEMRRFLQYGLEMGFRIDRCFMETLGHEDGGAAKWETANERIDRLKRIAQAGKTTAYQLEKELGRCHEARLVRFLASSGIVDLEETKVPEDSRVLFVYTGKKIPIDNTRHAFECVVNHIQGNYNAGDGITYSDFRTMPSFPGDDTNAIRIIKRMIGDGLLEKYSKNGLVVAKANPATYQFVNWVITPIEGAAQGDVFYDNVVTAGADSYVANKRERLEKVIGRFANFYKTG